MKYISKNKIIWVLFALIILAYNRYNIRNFIASGCEIKEDCKLCLPLTTINRDAFTEQKFESLRNGMKFEEVNKIIGLPYSQKKLDYGGFVACYSIRRKNFFTNFYRAYYLYYTEDKLLYDNLTSIEK
ncbi:MAG: hypothetical protein K1X55_17350 [Chitinophagales bacterium]|nr:hypothetical protein [Chitinophagales bacterium]